MPTPRLRRRHQAGGGRCLAGSVIRQLHDDCDRGDREYSGPASTIGLQRGGAGIYSTSPKPPDAKMRGRWGTCPPQDATQKREFASRSCGSAEQPRGLPARAFEATVWLSTLGTGFHGRHRRLRNGNRGRARYSDFPRVCTIGLTPEGRSRAPGQQEQETDQAVVEHPSFLAEACPRRGRTLQEKPLALACPPHRQKRAHAFMPTNLLGERFSIGPSDEPSFQSVRKVLSSDKPVMLAWG